MSSSFSRGQPFFGGLLKVSVCDRCLDLNSYFLIQLTAQSTSGSQKVKGKKRDPDHVGRGLLAVEIRSDPKLVMMSAWKLWAGSLSFLFPLHLSISRFLTLHSSGSLILVGYSLLSLEICNGLMVAHR